MQKILFLFIIAAFLSCNDKNSSVPGIYVNTYVYLNNPSSNALSSVGGSIYADGGLKGLIVYKRGEGDFAAYERNCSYNSKDACAIVNLDTKNTTGANCNCCHSSFTLIDGTRVSGPATEPLRHYQTLLEGNVIHIFN